MRVLITGGAGFIGANLCQRLVDGGHDVAVIDNFSSGFRSNLEGIEADVREADIRDLQALRSAARGVETVVHLAARPSVPRSIEDPRLSHDVNANGTVNVLLAARDEGAHVIFASSSSVYGANKRLPKREDMRPQPLSPYAASKLAGESYLFAFGHVYQLPVLAFRLFNVYGPLQSAGHGYAAVIPSFVDHLLKDHPLIIHGDGKQCRDFTSVGSAVGVLASAVERTVSCEDPVNLALGTRTTLLGVVALLEQITERHALVRHGPERAGDVRASQADSTRLRGLFSHAEPQSLDQGIRATIHWFEYGAAQQR